MCILVERRGAVGNSLASKSYRKHLQSHNLEINGECAASTSIAQANEVEIENLDQTDDVAEVDSPDVSLSVANGTFQSLLQNNADAFVCKFYSKPGLPRNVVQDIVNDTQSFLSDGPFVSILEDKVLDALKSTEL